jgi:hypothetical protein
MFVPRESDQATNLDSAVHGPQRPAPMNPPNERAETHAGSGDVHPHLQLYGKSSH